MAIDEGREGEVRIVATEFLRRRPVIVMPFLAFTLAALVASGAPSRQVAALGAAATAFSAMFLLERRTGKTRTIASSSFARSLSLTTIGIGIGSTVTGGLASPLLPMLAAPIGVGFAAFGRSKRSAMLLGLLVVVVVALFALSPMVRDLALPEGPRRIVLAAALVDSALLLRVGVTSLADAHARAAETLAAAGDEIARSAVARTRALESMGAKVAHEVKNPLTAIRAIVEVMLESSDAHAGKRLSIVAGEIARIEQILDGYGSMTHPFELRRATCDVEQLVDRLVTMLEPRAARAGVRLSSESTRGLTFDVDRDRLAEALLNLVLNALEATPAGEQVSLRATLAGAALELSVTDTGRGMDSATLAKIATPFFTQRAGGTGLGVSLARQVAEQHGGALTYESVAGRGTTATLRLSADATHRPDL